MKVSKFPKNLASNFTSRVPVSDIVSQQGFSKLPITDETLYGLLLIVWWFVTSGEIKSRHWYYCWGGIGLKYFIGLGDIITRFSGVTTGV